MRKLMLIVHPPLLMMLIFSHRKREGNCVRKSSISIIEVAEVLNISHGLTHFG